MTRTKILKSTKIIAIKIVNKMIPEIFFNFNLMVVRGWDRLIITGMLFQSLGYRYTIKIGIHHIVYGSRLMFQFKTS